MTAAERVWESAGQRQHDYFLTVRAERARWLRTTREALWDRWGGCCAICRGSLRIRDITIDHICPKRREGTDELFNLRPLCRACHRDLNRHDQCLGSLLLAWLVEASAASLLEEDRLDGSP